MYYITILIHYGAMLLLLFQSSLILVINIIEIVNNFDASRFRSHKNNVGRTRRLVGEVWIAFLTYPCWTHGCPLRKHENETGEEAQVLGELPCN